MHTKQTDYIVGVFSFFLIVSWQPILLSPTHFPVQILTTSILHFESGNVRTATNGVVEGNVFFCYCWLLLVVIHRQVAT